MPSTEPTALSVSVRLFYLGLSRQRGMAALLPRAFWLYIYFLTFCYTNFKQK